MHINWIMFQKKRSVKGLTYTMLDVRVKHGADASSDHLGLVVAAKLKVKLKRCEIAPSTRTK